VGGNSNIFGVFTGKIGEMIQFDFRILFKWVGEKPPTSENRPFNAPKGSGTV